ncbi:MAG: sugar phosphate isomerase/epimerase [Firmicutes bacterium]|nr:sugar phosphate isomerase/epimerase [Bacillota bacterium]
MESIYGVSSVHFPWNSVEETFEQCVKSNFDLIEFFTDRFTDEQAKKIRQLSSKTGVKVGYHAPYVGEYDLGINATKDLLPKIDEIMQIATGIEAKYVVTHLGTYGADRGQSLEHLVSLLSKHVVPRLEEHDIPLGLENFTLCHGDKALGDRISDFEYIFSNVKSPLIRLTIDYGHGHITRDLDDYIERLGHKLVSTHIADNDTTDDQHVAVGKGTVAWGKVIEATVRTGFRGPFIMECDDPVGSGQKIRRIIETVDTEGK